MARGLRGRRHEGICIKANSVAAMAGTRAGDQRRFRLNDREHKSLTSGLGKEREREREQKDGKLIDRRLLRW